MVVRIFGLLATSMILAGCAQTQRAMVLRTLTTSIGQEPRACVPLGWMPIPVADSLVPGTSIEVDQADDGVWLRSAWVGRIPARQLHSQNVQRIQILMNRLQEHGLVQRFVRRNDVRYALTMQGLRYYYDDGGFGNNPLHLPYLCYATIEPLRITQLWPVRRNASSGRETFSAAFTWVSQEAPWGSDAFIKAHTVMFQPEASPTIATFERFGSDWSLKSLPAAKPPGPRLSNADIWRASSSSSQQK